jgi:cell division septation protein DedD
VRRTPRLAPSFSPPSWVVKVKERLTGAMILVALIVLLVPELLTGPIRSGSRGAAVASSTEEAQLRSYTINLADDAHAHSAATAASGPAQPAPLAAPAPAPTDPPQAASAPPPVDAVPPPPSAPVAKAPAQRAPAPTPPSTSAPPASSGWVVQLGSFASEANAERLAQQLRAQGFPVSVSQSASGRHLYRVRAGPVREHAAAIRLAQKLGADGHPGAVQSR